MNLPKTNFLTISNNIGQMIDTMPEYALALEVNRNIICFESVRHTAAKQVAVIATKISKTSEARNLINLNIGDFEVSSHLKTAMDMWKNVIIKEFYKIGAEVNIYGGMNEYYKVTREKEGSKIEEILRGSRTDGLRKLNPTLRNIAYAHTELLETFHRGGAMSKQKIVISKDGKTVMDIVLNKYIDHIHVRVMDFDETVINKKEVKEFKEELQRYQNLFNDLFESSNSYAAAVKDQAPMLERELEKDGFLTRQGFGSYLEETRDVSFEYYLNMRLKRLITDLSWAEE